MNIAALGVDATGIQSNALNLVRARSPALRGKGPRALSTPRGSAGIRVPALYALSHDVAIDRRIEHSPRCSRNNPRKRRRSG